MLFLRNFLTFVSMGEMIKKMSKRQRRKLQVKVMKLTLLAVAILLPLILLPKQKENEYAPPMHVVPQFVDLLIHAQATEACKLATPQSADDIHFYATWINEAVAHKPRGNVRFEVTHMYKTSLKDAMRYVKGKVSVKNDKGEWKDMHIITLQVVKDVARGWVVHYDNTLTQWCE